jgi:hypothetical protein
VSVPKQAIKPAPKAAAAEPDLDDEIPDDFAA